MGTFQRCTSGGRGGILSVGGMRKLNYEVDGEKRQAKDVAREFLLRNGFMK